MTRYSIGKTKQFNTVKLLSKGHPRERQTMAIIDRWSISGGFFVLFYQPLKTCSLYFKATLFNFNRENLLKCGLYLQGGLYSEVVFNKGLTVYEILTRLILMLTLEAF